jgi:hypothetical protein
MAWRLQMAFDPLLVEPVPADLMSWAVHKLNIGGLKPPFLRAGDVVYHGGDYCVFEMFLDASRLRQMANLLGDVTTLLPVPLTGRFDPHLWGGVVPFKLVTRNSMVAMAHYEVAKDNRKRLHDIDMGDAKVRVVLTISSSAFTKALLQGRAIIDSSADGVIFVKPITAEFYDDFTFQEQQITVVTPVSTELSRLP